MFSRRIVGWRVSGSLRSDLALDDLDQGPLHPAMRAAVHGSWYGAISKKRGNSYDNALAESIIGLYEAELI